MFDESGKDVIDVSRDEANLTRLSISQISSSLNSSNGSRFSRMLPANNCASCGIVVIRFLIASSFNSEMSLPSIEIKPLSNSNIRFKQRTNVDLL